MRVGPIDQREIDALARSAGMRRHLQDVADRVVEEARHLAPVESGRLRRGIDTEDASDRDLEIRIGWRRDTAPYGGLVELGTEDTPARPHLVPAARKVQDA